MSDVGVRHPVSVMAEARRLHADSDGAWSARQIARQLERTHGVKPSQTTVLRWIDPAAHARERARKSAARRAALAEGWTFEMAGAKTPEWRAGLVRRLRAEGMLRTQIALACTVLFGEPWSRHDVRVALGEPTR